MLTTYTNEEERVPRPGLEPGSPACCGRAGGGRAAEAAPETKEKKGLSPYGDRTRVSSVKTRYPDHWTKGDCRERRGGRLPPPAAARALAGPARTPSDPQQAA